jgi:two-component system, cell cycle sensor histidine kinase and response regulator CckA
MASGVAHDFNNLLAVIGMATGTATPHGDAATLSSRHLDAIEDAVDQGREMVGTLMSFARQEATATPVQFDLHELIRTHEAQLSDLMGQSQSLRFALAEDACPLRGDPPGVLRLLSNLVANARDAMPAGGTVTLGTVVTRRGRASSGAEPNVAGRPHVSLTLRDEGTGIPADVLPRIFDPFFSTKAAGKGSGLGLALAQAFVRSAGGDIRVRESTPQGTTFEVLLPLAG